MDIRVGALLCGRTGGSVARASGAVKAVHDAPAIRTDLVERMRAQLASGELGSDAGQLADSLIDSITDKSGIYDK